MTRSILSRLAGRLRGFGPSTSQPSRRDEDVQTSDQGRADDHAVAITLTCGHGRPRWIPEGFSILERVYCGDCGDMVRWVRCGWTGIAPEPGDRA